MLALESSNKNEKLKYCHVGTWLLKYARQIWYGKCDTVMQYNVPPTECVCTLHCNEQNHCACDV